MSFLLTEIICYTINILIILYYIYLLILHMIRYRNFRTFVSPRPVQFASLAIDSTGEFVAAGGQDVFEAYLWSMKIGRLLEVRIE